METALIFLELTKIRLLLTVFVILNGTALVVFLTTIGLYLGKKYLDWLEYLYNSEDGDA